MRSLQIIAYKSLNYRNITKLHHRNYTQLRITPKPNPEEAPFWNFIRLARYSSPAKCWNCGATKPSSLLCGNCNVLQEPQVTDNYFKLLDLDENFNVDPKALTTTYRRLQSVLHPDKYSNKSEREKTISGDYSALVNKAYNTLQQPLLRALHMLKLRGGAIEEDQKVTDPEFLMKIMELNEEVEEANTPDALKQLNKNNLVRLEQLGKEFSMYCNENDTEQAKDAIIKMKYYNSLGLRINELLREKGIVD